MINNKQLDEITYWVAELCGDGRRKDGKLSHIHPARVGEFLKEKGYNNNFRVVAVLHDVIEDFENISARDVKKKLKVIGVGVIDRERIVEAVTLLTKNSKLKDNDIYMKKYIGKIENNKYAKIVKIADRIDNIMDHEGLKNKGKYLIETEKWFKDLAKDTDLLPDLICYIEFLRVRANEEKMIAKATIEEERER